MTSLIYMFWLMHVLSVVALNPKRSWDWNKLLVLNTARKKEKNNNYSAEWIFSMNWNTSVLYLGVTVSITRSPPPPPTPPHPNIVLSFLWAISKIFTPISEEPYYQGNKSRKEAEKRKS